MGVTTMSVQVRTEILSPAAIVSQKGFMDTTRQIDTNDNLSVATDSMIEEIKDDELDPSVKSEKSGPSSGEIKHTGNTIGYVESRNIPIGPLGISVTAPEEKRRIIGDVFIKIAQSTCKELDLDHDDVLYCQGTLRPDLIESASHLVSGRADVIKTHHNTTPMVQYLQKQGKVLEPLADFHKDEVREIGKRLKLPDELVHRHPFPGPGLAIRILCGEEAHIERNFTETTSIIKMVAGYHHMSQRPHALLNRINNAIRPDEQKRLAEVTAERSIVAHLLPINSVGCQGDHRTYSYACALSSSADPVWKDLIFIAQLIPRICPNINRVVYVFGDQVAHPIHDITPTFLTDPVVECLREADDRVMKVLRASDCYDAISQLPVILIPIHFDRDPTQTVPLPSMLRSIVLRPVVTSDFMTGLAAQPGVHIPEEVVYNMQKAAISVPGISRVLYDLTSKPPGTIEWE